ncbi:MAG: hypothetical protein HOC52_02280 [Thiotrichales bacterium]|nr:hypothetical protein [Thiotrichales bacterium]
MDTPPYFYPSPIYRVVVGWILLFVTTTLLAATSDQNLINLATKVFPRMVAVDQQLSGKTDYNGNIQIQLYSLLTLEQ